MFIRILSAIAMVGFLGCASRDDARSDDTGVVDADDLIELLDMAPSHARTAIGSGGGSAGEVSTRPSSCPEFAEETGVYKGESNGTTVEFRAFTGGTTGRLNWGEIELEITLDCVVDGADIYDEAGEHIGHAYSKDDKKTVHIYLYENSPAGENTKVVLTVTR
jgi:hypothetical protein